jgi:hypothetical protein
MRYIYNLIFAVVFLSGWFSAHITFSQEPKQAEEKKTLSKSSSQTDDLVEEAEALKAGNAPAALNQVEQALAIFCLERTTPISRNGGWH